VKKVLTNEERERLFAEEAWLQYLNRYLLLNHVISDKEYKLMLEKIASRKSKLSHENPQCE